MKSNLISRILAGCAFIAYFFATIAGNVISGIIGDYNPFTYQVTIQYILMFFGIIIIAVSLFIDFRPLAIGGCALCAISWIPVLISNINGYANAKENDYWEPIMILWIIIPVLLLAFYLFLIGSCLSKKISLILGIIAAAAASVSLFSNIYYLTLNMGSPFVINNIINIVAVIFLICGAITMGIAFSREKNRKKTANNPPYNPYNQNTNHYSR